MVVSKTRLKVIAESSIVLIIVTTILSYLYYTDDGIVIDDKPGIIDKLLDLGGVYMVVVCILTVALSLSLVYLIIRSLTIKK